MRQLDRRTFVVDCDLVNDVGLVQEDLPLVIYLRRRRTVYSSLPLSFPPPPLYWRLWVASDVAIIEDIILVNKIYLILLWYFYLFYFLD